MIYYLLLPCFFLLSQISLAQANKPQAPLNWHRIGPPQAYDQYITDVVRIGDNGVGHIKALNPEDRSFGGFSQNIKADKYRGKRIRVSARFKIRDVENYFSIWMRVDSKYEGISLAFDNMQGRGIKGTQDWNRKSIILEVPEEAVNIIFGTFISGKGEAWIDDFALEEVDRSLGVTDYSAGMTVNIPKDAKEREINPDLPDKPQNLDFEQLEQ